jgi:hypothetical protein
MIDGPDDPRDSKFSTTPPPAASGFWLTKRLGAAQARLLSVGEHEHGVVAGSRSVREHPRRLQQRRHTGAIVVAAVGHLDRVVVGNGEYATGRCRAGQHGHYVVDVRHREVVAVVRVLADRVLDLRLEAIARKCRDDVVANAGRRRAAGHVHLRADAFDVLERPSGTEPAGRRVGRRGRGRQDGPDAEEREDGQGGQGDEAGDAAVAEGAIHGHILPRPRPARDPGHAGAIPIHGYVFWTAGRWGSALRRDRAADRGTHLAAVPAQVLAGQRP